MPQWEYREVRDMEEITRLGAEGWEAIAPTGDGAFLMKRPQPSLRDRMTDESVEAFFAAGGGEMEAPEGGSELLNADLAYILRCLGHTDMIVISDMGFPMPDLQYTLDLSVKAGVPTVPEVLEAIGTDFDFSEIMVAAEVHRAVPERVEKLQSMFESCAIKDCESHTEFKHMAALCKAGIRTGDPTPFGNVILVCG
ncbi:MAG: D-ribose pyranase [Armatimonadota bacterium]